MNLRGLLKRDSQRQLHLIETLYYSQHPRSSEELSKTVQCTIPALLSDIRAINAQSDYYKVVRENSLYRLELKDNASIDALYSNLITHSVAFRILETIFFEECYTLSELSSKLFCSLTTIQASMKDLQETLKQWKITIQRRPFRLTGNEIAIRHLLFLYFSEKKVVRDNTPRLSSEFFDYGEEVVRSMIAENNFSVSLAQYNRLSTTFFINLVRIANGHRIPTRSLRSTSVVPPSQRTIHQFGTYLRKDLNMIYSEDVMKDSFWLLYSDLFLLGENQRVKALETNFKLAYHYETHFEFADKLSRMLTVPLTEHHKETLATILINQHLFHAQTKEFISLVQDRKKDCLHLLETFHAHCVHQLRNLVIEFTNDYQLFGSQEFIDNYIYQIIATVPSCLNGMKKTEKPLDMLIISKDSTMQESLLIELIRFSIRGNYEIHQIDLHQLKNDSYLEVFQKYDLVISTSTFDVPDCQTPIIAVELCPSIQSLNRIQNLIDQAIMKNSSDPVLTN